MGGRCGRGGGCERGEGGGGGEGWGVEDGGVGAVWQLRAEENLWKRSSMAE